MIANWFIMFVSGFLAPLSVIALPAGFSAALGLLRDLIGFINIFVPILRLAPVVGLIILVRNWRVLVAILRFVLRFIPFFG